MKENKIACFNCGAKLTKETEYTFDGNRMCQHCYDNLTVTCDNCGERIWRENERGDDAHNLCISCYENCYTNCEDCGRLIHNDDAYYEDGEDYPYCHNCFEKLNNHAIKNYSYKPEPIFYGSGNLFYGVELEVDKGGEDNSNAQVLLDEANKRGEKIYCKHDGSINDGFEIVSHPMSLEYHINNMRTGFVFLRMRQRWVTAPIIHLPAVCIYIAPALLLERIMRKGKRALEDLYSLLKSTGMSL